MLGVTMVAEEKLIRKRVKVVELCVGGNKEKERYSELGSLLS